MLNPNRHVTRVAGLVGTLILAAACSSGGGATTAPTTAPVSTAPSAAPASLPASAAPSAAPSEAAGGSYELTVAKSASLGDYVAGEDGMTLYTFDPDTAPNKSTCNGDCATTWPPFVLETGETATAGTGISGTIATFARDDGSTQVSYNGKPVYYFKNDKAAGDTNGEGVAGKWHVVKP